MRKLFALAKKYTFFTPSKTCYGSDIGFPAIMGLAVFETSEKKLLCLPFFCFSFPFSMQVQKQAKFEQ